MQAPKLSGKRNSKARYFIRSKANGVRASLRHQKKHTDMKTPADRPNKFKDNLITPTSELQENVENLVMQCSKYDNIELHKDKHIAFLCGMLRNKLPSGYKSLDASKPWLIYWNINALALLGHDIENLLPGVSSTILSCVSQFGGLGGGYMQYSHLAATYAGITVLAYCGSSVWNQLKRDSIYKWLMSLKLPDGSFKMSHHGEADPRSVYCALAIASLLNILSDELIFGVGEYIESCQTYEGGFGNAPGAEAHGGYAFCALAALCIIGPPQESINKHCDVQQLAKWLSQRQYQREGGFSGRTNKLVDGCYNHWIGGCWPLLENALCNSKDGNPIASLWDRERLKKWTISCCQNDTYGGLRDKPGASPDSYHSNYVLSGLSSANHIQVFKNTEKSQLGDYAYLWHVQRVNCEETDVPLPINPIHVLPVGVAEKMRGYFMQRDNLA